MRLVSLVILTVVIALIFDFFNGFHDAANSVATVVSTRVLRPLQAVVWAAVFNFLAAFFFGVHIATTIGKGVVHPQTVDVFVVLSALLGAIVWDLITWQLGLPTSSSHALVGGLVGAAFVKAGPSALLGPGIIKICLFIVLSPMIGLFLGYLNMILVARIVWRVHRSKTDHYFRRLQLLSAALYSLGHGTNDAQKTMGVIAILLFTNRAHMVALTNAHPWLGFLHMPEFRIAWWIILSAHAAIALGTLSGGWRIIKTMGMRVTQLKPVGGFCAETAAAVSLFGTALAGIPVSTTHTITGAIVGVGAIRRLSAVRWGITLSIVWAWILTIPCSAAIAAISWWLINLGRSLLH
jgi:PiT family inorganic phosphate transporter